MMVNKITEVTVFESPDGGRTVYARSLVVITENCIVKIRHYNKNSKI
jgi:hypothetical protein